MNQRDKSPCFPVRHGGFQLLLLIFGYTISSSILVESNKICRSPSFFCARNHDKSTCAPPEWKCDGTVQCKDGIDEVNCTTAGQDDAKCGFRCDNGECIHKDFQCDFQRDCIDGSDEINCGEMERCDHCLNGGLCVKYSRHDFHCVCQSPWTGPLCNEKESEDQCTKNNPCINGGTCNDFGDRITCSCPVGWRGLLCETRADGECGRREFECDNGHCIISRFRCDGIPHCLDNSDEENCTTIVPSFCTGKYDFLCKSYECIASRHRCDGFAHCRDASDEANCDDDIAGNDNSSEGVDNYIYINSDYQTVTYTIICSLVMLVVVIVCVVGALHHYRRRLRFRYQLAMANIRRRQRPRSNIYVPPPILPSIRTQIDGQADPDQTHVLMRYSINNGVQIITLGEERNAVSPCSTTTSQSSPLVNDEAPPTYWDVVHGDNSRRHSSSSSPEGSPKSADSPPPPYPGLRQQQIENS